MPLSYWIVRDQIVENVQHFPVESKSFHEIWFWKDTLAHTYASKEHFFLLNFQSDISYNFSANKFDFKFILRIIKATFVSCQVVPRIDKYSVNDLVPSLETFTVHAPFII